ncbi:MAG: hypothetical protein JRM85_07820 [Nitrososphaerota archaeon]|nr:hypothetical protein [Nitrososphaerota archaeon]
MTWRTPLSDKPKGTPVHDGWTPGSADALAAGLVTCGLTLNQAKVYVYLLLRGPSTVHAISRDLGVHRVEVYRKVRDLDGLGLIETYLEDPKRYAAVEPSVASSVLLRRQEERLSAFESDLKEAFSKLESARRALGPQLERQRGPGEGSYRFVRGRRRYYKEMAALARGAKTEILRIVSPGGVARTVIAGLDREYEEARRRGVETRMICEVDRRNRAYAKRLSKVVQLKHLSGVRLRFTVVDRSVTMLGAKFDETSQSLDSAVDSYIVFDDPGLSEAFRMFFEHLWADAESVSRKAS